MRGGALGDFILGLPTLRALRDAYPEASIELIAPAAVLSLASHLVDKATPIELSDTTPRSKRGDLPTVDTNGARRIADS